jgi:hypothetical protein
VDTDHPSQLVVHAATCSRSKARLQGHGGKRRAGHEGVDSKMRDADGSEGGKTGGRAGGAWEAGRTLALRRQEAARGRTRGEGKTVFSWVTENLRQIRIEPKGPYTV